MINGVFIQNIPLVPITVAFGQAVRNGSIACNHPSVKSSYVHGIYHKPSVTPRQDGCSEARPFWMEHTKGRKAFWIFSSGHRAMDEAGSYESETAHDTNPIIKTT